MSPFLKLLEYEVNKLGPDWNLFGKVDRMKYLIKKLKEQLSDTTLRPERCLKSKNHNDCIVWIDEKRCIESCDLHK